MASLFISYFGAVDKHVATDPIKSEVVTTSSTSALSAAVPQGAVIASISSDAAHYVTFGAGSPTAAVGAASFYLPAGIARDLRIVNADGTARKFAAVTV